MSEKYQIRCVSCNDTRIITESDCKGDKQPRDKAKPMQSRVASKCEKCGEVRFGVSEA